MRSGVDRCFLLVGLSLMVGCEGPINYAGTGSLSVSGSTTQPLLAFHSLHFDWCMDPGPGDVRTLKGFSVVTIGNACVMDGTGRGLSAFQADPGTVCTLTFSDGAHPIRVTDFVVRSSESYPAGRGYVDGNNVEVQLGGEDAATHTQVLYRFSGNASADLQSSASCEVERTKRASRGAALAHGDEQNAP